MRFQKVVATNIIYDTYGEAPVSLPETVTFLVREDVVEEILEDDTIVNIISDETSFLIKSLNIEKVDEFQERSTFREVILINKD